MGREVDSNNGKFEKEKAKAKGRGKYELEGKWKVRRLGRGVSSKNGKGSVK